MYKRPKTLIINTWSSECGDCGKGAVIEEKTHDTVIGYDVEEGEKGCGVRWEFVDSDYFDLDMEKRCKKMRPDLEWNGFNS